MTNKNNKVYMHFLIFIFLYFFNFFLYGIVNEYIEFYFEVSDTNTSPPVGKMEKGAR